MITTQYLIDIGFRYEYIPSEKRWDHNKLSFFNFLDESNTVFFGLHYLKNVESWKLEYITLNGDMALDIIYRELKGNSSLESIIDFVKKNPRQTF